MKIIVFLGALLALLSGCVTQDMVIRNGYVGPDKVYTARMSARMQFRGFSVTRPNDTKWYSYISRQSSTEALFYYETGKPFASLYVSVHHKPISIDTNDENILREYVEKSLTALGPRHELISCKTEVAKVQGQVAIRYHVVVLDKAAPNAPEPLKLVLDGWDVVHPAFPKTLISIGYSTRCKSSDEDAPYIKSAEEFLNGVVLEKAPGVKL